jgi:hypothetical protein
MWLMKTTMKTLKSGVFVQRQQQQQQQQQEQGCARLDSSRSCSWEWQQQCLVVHMKLGVLRSSG